jgi:hypothetical protein
MNGFAIRRTILRLNSCFEQLVVWAWRPRVRLGRLRTMSKGAEGPMLKTNGWMLMVVMAGAVLLPAAPAQASELVKLGKLIVTGKRGPAAANVAVEPRASAPREVSNTQAPASERWFPKATTEPSVERNSAPLLPGFKLSVDASEPQAEPAELQRPSAESPRERVGKAAIASTTA